jgi:hypothetical protein
VVVPVGPLLVLRVHASEWKVVPSGPGIRSLSLGAEPPGAEPAVVGVLSPCPPRFAAYRFRITPAQRRALSPKLEVHPAWMLPPTPLRLDCWSRRNHPCERPAFSSFALRTVKCSS